MSTFEEREQSFEKGFAHDEEMRFKALARGARLLGMWAAEKLGKTGAEADAYAGDLVQAALAPSGEDAAFHRLRADFDAAGVRQSDHQIRRTMQETRAKAWEQIRAGR